MKPRAPSRQTQLPLLLILLGSFCALGKELEEAKQALAFQANEASEGSSSALEENNLAAGKEEVKASEDFLSESGRRRRALSHSTGSGYVYGSSRRRMFGHGNPYYGHPYGYGSPYGHGVGYHYGNPYGNHYGNGYGNPYGGHFGTPYSDGRRRRFFLTQQGAEETTDADEDAEMEMAEEVRGGRHRYGNPYSHGSPYGHHYGNPYGHHYGHGYGNPYGHHYGHGYGNPYGHHHGHGYGNPYGGGHHYGNHYSNPYGHGGRRRVFLTQQVAEETTDTDEVAEMEMTEEVRAGRRRYGNPYSHGSPYGHHYGNPYGHHYGHGYGNPYGHNYGHGYGNPYGHHYGHGYGNPYGGHGGHHGDGRRRSFFLAQQKADSASDASREMRDNADEPEDTVEM
eukprot:TRINITY_DN1127_c0_g1_i4.p1 TRINITY_DN1127_c0_g1~~TRINITY_DN1127_c0_g1_i4.p1  ORF type:complete len:416 (-),score=23.43 TRINITY_DN1127_c0_g1_i4:196-1380(-)